MTYSGNSNINVEYTYDANGNRASSNSYTYSVNELDTTYAYNLANLVTSMTNTPSNDEAETYTYTYYLDGNQRTKTEETKELNNKNNSYWL